jgi:ElaB/YqjD/DUF883 family membrane-anchored ribosome-binding protein
MDQATQALRNGENRLADDFRAVVSDAEQLLRHAAREAGDGYNEARERLEASLQTARKELASLEEAMVDGAVRAGKATDGYVHRHPWESIAVGAGVGVLLGLLIGRR